MTNQLCASADPATAADAVFRYLQFMQRSVTEKPWGFEFRVGESDVEFFIRRCFRGIRLPAEFRHTPTGPNVMLIREGHRLSWHYHERKDAFLRVLRGSVGAICSTTDAEPAPNVLLPGSTLRIPPFTRHRLMSLSGWAVVAEIAHVAFPSPDDGEDTVRLRDDYGRSGHG